MSTTTTKTAPKLVFGGFPIGPDGYFKDEESIAQVYTLLEQAGVTTIDTARLYGPSEEWMGKTGAGKRFIIDSKTPGGFIKGSSTSETIPQHAKDSVDRLKIDQLDIFYIHAPDASVPLEDALLGVNTAFKAGHFKRFGLSNFSAADVQRAYDICKEKGYPLPTVYQANYSAVARKQEELLIPTLRKLNIAFYVYSPIAGGLLTKSSAALREGGEAAGRFAKGAALEPLYGGLYNKPSYYEALDLWEEAAKEAGCSKAELAYRWVAFDSVVDGQYGDAIIFGASKHSHILDTAAWLKHGSVGEKAKARIDAVWKVVEKDAPLDNYH
ncbi:NADP-dependent oxidoreductase domain-containing protein, partial [Mycena filopes]